ncbi:uncharacterized protein LOC116294507 [Actinia tenebrosa]|uniref:Uncharacterized protein LOC116294507 n=1 Tax=Actinia tenebrosa TaxID=6105 RepID=A0A6P8HZE8_ACTTE|nr:uncharacterized protein LOC116294507 [Actinia tenebrosa]
MSTYSTALQLGATNGRTVLYSLLFITIEACVWLYEVWKRVSVWFLNCQILIITRWMYLNPDLRIFVDDIGLFRVYNVKVKWKDEVILSVEELHVSLEWKLTNLRNVSFRLHVKNLFKKLDSLEFMFTFNLYWRILPSPSTSTGLEHNQELKDEIKPQLTRLHATDGRIVMRLSRDSVSSRPSPKILLKVMHIMIYNYVQ